MLNWLIPHVNLHSTHCDIGVRIEYFQLAFSTLVLNYALFLSHKRKNAVATGANSPKTVRTRWTSGIKELCKNV